MNHRYVKWTIMGRYFGYPACCIEDFRKRAPGRNTKAQNAVHQNHGFIPCPAHAKEIIAGRATLESLIRGRLCPSQFPNDGIRSDKDIAIAIETVVKIIQLT